MNYAKEYIELIESGSIKVSKKIRQFYISKIKPILDDVDSKYYYDFNPGLKFIKFAEKYCKQSKGKWAGKPTRLMLFQKAKYQVFFGVRHRESGKRRFKEIFDVRARKNGKSTENSILALYLVLKEVGAEIYVAATTSSQAKRVWEESRTMMNQHKELQDRLASKVFPTSMIYTKTTAKKPITSYFQVLSREVKTFDGLNASGAIVDEVHELKREIYDILKQSMSARDEPIMSMITTAGFVRGGLFDDLYEYSKKVLDGVIEDDTLMPLIYELDDVNEIYDEESWIKANPALEEIKMKNQLQENVLRIQGDPNFANSVKVKDFNIIGVENRTWLSYEQLNVEETYSEEDLRKFDNTMVIGGFDLSRTGDVTAFTTTLFDKDNQKVIAITQYWITMKYLESEIAKSSKVPYQAWIDRGLIRISGSNLIDYHDIANYVSSNFKKYGWMYQHINYDSYSAQYLIQELEQMGYAAKYCLRPAMQGFKTLSIPMQTLQAHLESNILVYQNNPVTKWMLSNVELEQDRNGNLMPKKINGKTGRKIDGVATILNCYVSICENINSYLGLE